MMMGNDRDEPEVHVHKAITEGKEVKKSRLERAVSVFLKEDLETMTKDIVDNSVRPRFKDFLNESVRKIVDPILGSFIDAAEILIFGNTKKGGSTTKTGEYNGQKVNYVSYYDGTYHLDGSGDSKAAKNDDTIFKIVRIPNCRKAEEVKTELISLARRYPTISVADYYQCVSIPVKKKDYAFGWVGKELLEWFFETSDSRIESVKDGYVIKLPNPKPIKD